MGQRRSIYDTPLCKVVTYEDQVPPHANKKEYWYPVKLLRFILANTNKKKQPSRCEKTALVLLIVIWYIYYPKLIASEGHSLIQVPQAIQSSLIT